METVEMDLMQAQIGSLATDVSRLEAKVAKGGGGGSSADGIKTFVVTSIPDLGDPPVINSTGAFADYYGKTLVVFNNPPKSANTEFYSDPQSFGYTTTSDVRAIMQNPNIYFTVVDPITGEDTDTRYDGRLIIIDLNKVMNDPNLQKMVGEGADGECICVIIHTPSN